MKLLQLPWNYWTFALGQKGFVHPWQLSNWLFPAVCPKAAPYWDNLLSFSSRMSDHNLHRQSRDWEVKFRWCHNPGSTRNLPWREDWDILTLRTRFMALNPGQWQEPLDNHVRKPIAWEVCARALLQLGMPQGDGSYSWNDSSTQLKRLGSYKIASSAACTYTDFKHWSRNLTNC